MFPKLKLGQLLFFVIIGGGGVFECTPIEIGYEKGEGRGGEAIGRKWVCRKDGFSSGAGSGLFERSSKSFGSLVNW